MHPFSRWFQNIKLENEIRRTPEFLIFQILDRVILNSNENFDDWVLSQLKEFCEQDCDHTAKFQSVEKKLADFDLNFYEILSSIFMQILSNREDLLVCEIALMIADRVDLVSMRFLSAWVALNSSQLDRCIQEAEKVDTPYAALYTLQGQAYLEKGDLIAAIETLDAACKLSPKEVLAWFQLAKAYYASGKLLKADESLAVCRSIVGVNQEITCFRAIIRNSSFGSFSRESHEKILDELLGIELKALSKEGLEELLLLSSIFCTNLKARHVIKRLFQNIQIASETLGQNYPPLIAKISGLFFNVGWYHEASDVVQLYNYPKVRAVPVKAKDSSC